jgi:signal transduction histidine kinase
MSVRDHAAVSSGGAVLSALRRGISVGVPLAVALYAGRRPACARSGTGLLVASAMSAAAASVALAADRVAAQTSGLVEELKAVRSQSVAAGDSERRRIERDLHDGAQQQLVALSIHLELAAEKAELEDPAEAAALREMSREAEQALAQLRSLIRGMQPSSLREQGLEAAVRRAADRSVVPATVEGAGLQDYPAEITRAVYFCCLEALQNVAKHARGARSVHIELRDADSALSFSVSDDGPGIGDRGVRIGAGMINMRDRMATVGGRLIVQSAPGQGTRVSGRIPLSALAAPDGSPGDRRARRRAASEAPGRARGAMRLSHPW